MDKLILIVDDEALITKSLMRLLGSKGYGVTIAKNGIEALEVVKKSDFNLIICDVRMPGLDGIQTIKQIRAYLEKSDKKSIPEIVITGYADIDKYEQGRELEVAEYLSKPFDNNEFLRIVEKAIGQNK